MKLLEKVLNDVSLDPRIQDGVFSIEENTHMDVLREYLSNHGINEESAREYCNLVVEGKYPERQAYNEKGILVTFPTPEYKQRAIKRGTHFEKDPTKGQSNLFGGQPGAQQQAPQPGQQPPAAPAPQGQPATNLPLSQSGGAETPQSDTPKGDDGETKPEPQTTAAPIQVPTQPEEPVAKPDEAPPPPPPPSPAEKEANKDAIKQMLKGDDYMLETSGVSMPFEEIHKRMTQLVWEAMDSGYSKGEVLSACEMAINLYTPGSGQKQ